MRLTGCLLQQCFNVQNDRQIGLDVGGASNVHKGTYRLVPVLPLPWGPRHHNKEIIVLCTETDVRGEETESGSKPEFVIENA